MLHGGSGADYRHLLPLSDLSDCYFVIMWDQRGSGLSERIHRDEISFEYWVAELKAVKNHFVPEDKITLVGESWGGMYAMLYYQHHPEDVTQIALLEPGPLASSLAEPYEEEVNDYSLRDDWLNDMVWNMEFLGPYDHEQIDYKWMLVFEEAAGALLCYGDNSTHIWRYRAYMAYSVGHKLLDAPQGYDYTSNIDSITDPVLILASECSALGYEYQVTYHEPLFPNAQVRLIPESGHFTTVDAPGKVLAELKEFLKEYNKDSKL
ncbi:alpha/beta fold hydrolase [Candidatus Neomarinimicrobiota bacterium]